MLCWSVCNLLSVNRRGTVSKSISSHRAHFLLLSTLAFGTASVWTATLSRPVTAVAKCWLLSTGCRLSRTNCCIAQCFHTVIFQDLTLSVIYTRYIVSTHPPVRHTPHAYRRIHKSPPPAPIVSQLNPPPRPISLIHCDHVLPSTPWSSQWLFASGFPTKILYIFWPVPCVPHAPPSSFSLIWSAWLYLRMSTNYEAPPI
jgi:hypothetical protein